MPVHIVCVWFSYWKLAWKHISNAIQYEHTLERSYRFFIVPACTRLHCRARCLAWTVCWALFRNLATSESQPMECALVLWLHLKCFVSKVALLLFIYFFFSLFEQTEEKQIPISLCSGVVWKHNWNPLPKRVNIVCEKKKHKLNRMALSYDNSVLCTYTITKLFWKSRLHYMGNDIKWRFSFNDSHFMTSARIYLNWIFFY